MLSTVLKYLEEKHACPHCSQELSLCHAPPIHVGDGLGWGSEYLYICLNDDCPLFVKGWQYIENQYGHVGSYRHMQLPNSKEAINMMVVGKSAFKGSVVNIDELKRQNEQYQKVKKATQALDTCIAENDLEPVLFLLTSGQANIEVLKRAVQYLVELNNLDCIEPLRNTTFRNEELAMSVNMAINKILERHYLKECPYCTELVKRRAKLCKHCHQEL
ncbi:MAG: zinc ribbon domain-containing protein [Desulfobulbus propionicus]|nr:MAG: zinc ribbon domain-containing protein [Desulfobulbus propionicus]